MQKKRIRVLVVEDHEPTAYLIRKAFEARSPTVEWDICFAKDGEEALDCVFKRGMHAQAALPDFVLLDWNLPVVSGDEVLRVLKSSEAVREVPVIVFSASEAEEDVKQAYRGHANGYIQKPSDIDALFAVIESIENFWVHTARLPSTFNGHRASA